MRINQQPTVGNDAQIAQGGGATGPGSAGLGSGQRQKTRIGDEEAVGGHKNMVEPGKGDIDEPSMSVGSGRLLSRTTMPELPEVEQVRRSLAPHMVGARCTRAVVGRADFVQRSDGPRSKEALSAQLLEGDQIIALRRRGKQIAVEGRTGRVVVIHLGMTGRVRYFPLEDRIGMPGLKGAPLLPARLPHAHVWWEVEAGGQQRGSARRGVVVFQDPRRFGYVKTFVSMEHLLATDWAHLGPDALEVTAEHLQARLRRTKRAVKAAILDQRVLAGVGNIYADESLFAARIRPGRRASTLKHDEVETLTLEIRRILNRSIRRGGTTIRDYVDGKGRVGTFTAELKVYGRLREACVECGSRLQGGILAQRTTVWCPKCQRAH